MAVLRLEHVAQAKMVPQQRLAELWRLAVEVADVQTRIMMDAVVVPEAVQVNFLPEEAHLLIVVQLSPDSLISVTTAAQVIVVIPTVVAVAVGQEALALTEQMSRQEMAVQVTCCQQNSVEDTLRVVVAVEMASPIIQ
jgi:hypothetical protein